MIYSGPFQSAFQVGLEIETTLVDLVECLVDRGSVTLLIFLAAALETICHGVFVEGLVGMSRGGSSVQECQLYILVRGGLECVHLVPYCAIQ